MSYWIKTQIQKSCKMVDRQINVLFMLWCSNLWLPRPFFPTPWLFCVLCCWYKWEVYYNHTQKREQKTPVRFVLLVFSKDSKVTWTHFVLRHTRERSNKCVAPSSHDFIVQQQNPPKNNVLFFSTRFFLMVRLQCDSKSTFESTLYSCQILPFLTE